MPGIHDAHTHLVLSGLKFGHDIRVTQFAPPDQVIAELVELFPPNSPDKSWIVAGEVYSGTDSPDRLTRKHLDAVWPDRPVWLYDYSVHHGVANSRALELAGITGDDEYGHGGQYRRFEDGSLTGELIEEAAWKVMRLLPQQPLEARCDALRWSQAKCHKFGITSVQEALANELYMEAYKTLDNHGELKLRVATHLIYANEGFGAGSREELNERLADYKRWNSEHIDSSFVKVVMDGAPLPPIETNVTMKEDGTVDDSWLLVQEDELFELVQKFDAEGRTVKIHCAGDGAVHVALNALERVRAVRGPGVPHEIAHAGFVPEEDYLRFGPLNITAEMSPALWHVPEFGLGHGFWFSKMLQVGARMTIGTDWAIAADPNLFPALQGVVQHQSHPIDLEHALAALTRVGAEAVSKSEERGALSPGMKADYIILDRDLFAIDVNEIGGTVVMQKYFDGALVYEAETVSEEVS